MKIRNAVNADFADIHALNQEVLFYECHESQFKDILSLAWHALFVVEEDDKIIGYIHTQRYYTTYFPPLLHILALAVSPSHQGLGIATKLMNHTEQYAKENGLEGLRLTSDCTREGAHQFYERFGFTRTVDQLKFRKMF